MKTIRQLAEEHAKREGVRLIKIARDNRSATFMAGTMTYYERSRRQLVNEGAVIAIRKNVQESKVPQ